MEVSPNAAASNPDLFEDPTHSKPRRCNRTSPLSDVRSMLRRTTDGYTKFARKRSPTARARAGLLGACCARARAFWLLWGRCRRCRLAGGAGDGDAARRGRLGDAPRSKERSSTLRQTLLRHRSREHSSFTSGEVSISSDIVKTRPHPGYLRPNSAEALAKFRRVRPEFGRNRVKLGRLRAEFNQKHSKSAHRPNRTKFGRFRAKCGPSWPISPDDGEMLELFRLVSPNAVWNRRLHSARYRPMLVNLRRSSARLGLASVKVAGSSTKFARSANNLGRSRFRPKLVRCLRSVARARAGGCMRSVSRERGVRKPATTVERGQSALPTGRPYHSKHRTRLSKPEEQDEEADVGEVGRSRAWSG